MNFMLFMHYKHEIQHVQIFATFYVLVEFSSYPFFLIRRVALDKSMIIVPTRISPRWVLHVFNPRRRECVSSEREKEQLSFLCEDILFHRMIYGGCCRTLARRERGFHWANFDQDCSLGVWKVDQ